MAAAGAETMRNRGDNRAGRKPRAYVFLGTYTNFAAFCIDRCAQKDARQEIEEALEAGDADRLRAAAKSYGVCLFSPCANKFAG